MQIELQQLMIFNYLLNLCPILAVSVLFPLISLVEMGPLGVIVVHYSPCCYSDVGEAGLYWELLKEGLGASNYKELYGQRKLINAEINKQFGPEFFMVLV